MSNSATVIPFQQPPQRSAPTNDWVSVEDVCKIFGASKRTLYDWRDKGILPKPYKLRDTQALVFKWSEIEARLEPVDVGTRAERAVKAAEENG
jgi:predicted DNA-binding transcriptional regulator AlpA